MTTAKKIIYWGIIACQFSLASAESIPHPPFNANEMAIIKSHMFQNITSVNNSFTKTHATPVIHSIPGAVLASPSFRSPDFSQDYQFHWMRDAALTMNQIADLYEQASDAEKKHLNTYLKNYLSFEQKAQQDKSVVGEYTNGQPKFNVDGTIWEGKWWRPQNDAPALRAITMLHLATIFTNEKSFDDAKTAITVCKNDLDYIVTAWQHPTYDLWEETLDKDHFFTKLMQRKALILGAQQMRLSGDTMRAMIYQKTANKLSESLKQHWNDQRGYITETINQQFYKGGGLNTSIILGALYGDMHTKNKDWTVQDPRIMSTVYYLRNSFAMLYRLNINHPNLPPLLGRYPNDIYDGKQFNYGNPWILTTNALAQYYYALANAYQNEKKIIITPVNELFFQQLNTGLHFQPGIISLKDKHEEFNTIVLALIKQGDEILNNVKQYQTCTTNHPELTDCYHFSEQIDRTTGKSISAKDLTWGYVTLISAMQTRAQFLRLNS